MMKKIIITLCLTLLCFTASLAQKSVVWENPTTEFGTDYGDGFFNIAIDVTRVELKMEEATVAVRLQLRSDYPDPRFQFTKGNLSACRWCEVSSCVGRWH